MNMIMMDCSMTSWSLTPPWRRRHPPFIPYDSMKEGSQNLTARIQDLQRFPDSSSQILSQGLGLIVGMNMLMGLAVAPMHG